MSYLFLYRSAHCLFFSQAHPCLIGVSCGCFRFPLLPSTLDLASFFGVRYFLEIYKLLLAQNTEFTFNSNPRFLRNVCPILIIIANLLVRVYVNGIKRSLVTASHLNANIIQTARRTAMQHCREVS